MRRLRNPWTEMDESDLAQQGRAAITVGLHAGPLRFSAQQVVKLVGRVADASVVSQVGVTRDWGTEPSCQVVLWNMGMDGRPRFSWAAFVNFAKLLAEQLADALAQEVVVLETQSSTGRYQSVPYVNGRAAEQRERLLAKRAARR